MPTIARRPIPAAALVAPGAPYPGFGYLMGGNSGSRNGTGSTGSGTGLSGGLGTGTNGGTGIGGFGGSLQ